MGMKDKQLAKEIAERRMRMIAPLVGVLSSPEEYYEKHREISVMYEISTRTLQRYMDSIHSFVRCKLFYGNDSKALHFILQI